MRPVTTLLLFILLSHFATAQEWRDLFNQSQTHITNGNYQQALVAADGSLEDFLESDGSVNGNYAAILHSLVQINFELGNYPDAIIHGEKEIKVLETMGSADGATLAGAHYNLGSSYFMNDNFKEAAGSFSSTLTIYKNSKEPDDYDLLKTEWKLAAAYYFNGEAGKARTHFDDSFAKLDPNDIDGEYLEAAYYYGELLTEQKDYEKSAPILSTLRDIYEANELTDEPTYPFILRMLGSASVNNGNENAEALINEILELSSSKLEGGERTSFLNEWATALQQEGHSDISALILNETSSGDSDANSLNNLATIAFNNQDYTKAGNLYVEALSSISKDENSNQYAGIAENLVVLLETIGDLENAEKYQREAVDIYSLGNNNRLAHSKTVLGRILKLRGNSDSALELYLEAMPDLEPDSQDYAEAMNGLASLYQQTGDYQKADSAYQISLRVAKDQSEKTHAAVLNNLGSYYRETGKFLMASNQFQQALTAIAEVYGKNSVPYINTLQNLALLDLEIGKYQNSVRLIEEAETITKELFGNTDRMYSQVLLNKGRVLISIGDYPGAEPVFKEAVQIRESIYGTDSEQYAEAINSLAYFYQTVGNFLEAQPLFENAIRILDDGGAAKGINYSTALENLASLYQMQGLFEKAEPLLEESLEIDRRLLGEDHPLYSTTLHNLASLYKELKKYDQSERLFREALEIDARSFGENHPGYARTLFNLAALLQDKEEYEEAERLYEKVAELRLELLGENHPEYAFSLYGLASIKRVLNKPEALEYYTQSITKYLDQIKNYFPAMSEQEKSAFYEKIKPVFESFKDYAIEQAVEGNTEVLKQLYDLQLSTKALLLSATSKIRQRILASGDEELKTNFSEWIELKEQLVKFSNLTIEELKEENIDLNQIVIDANALEKAISERSQLFSEEIGRSTITWENVQGALKPGEAVIDIMRVEKTYVDDSVLYAALIIKPGLSPSLTTFKLGNQLETRMFNYYRNAIKYTVGDEISYTNYWKAIESHLSDVETIYISTDGIFNKISFNTLWDHERELYVIDEYKIRILSNSREVVEKRPQSNNSIRTAGVFGNPDFGNPPQSKGTLTRTSNYGFSRGVPSLPGSKEEVENLTSTLSQNQWNPDTFVEREASEENFKKINSPRLLHIATHGFFMSDLKLDSEAKAYGIHLQNELANPLFRSGLLFSGANATLTGDGYNGTEDGILTAYEAMNLNLDQTELVVMSACETGLGKIKNGEGVYGLQRAFIVAGARNVIMSLWTVSDESTQKLMNIFYENWLGGMDKVEAFTKAQLELKKEYPDPYHWGAFVILGN